MPPYFEPTLRLHAYLVASHWNGRALMGPDPGIRFNYRIGRFAKNYVPRRFWNDDLYYLQGQGYWILANWHLYDVTGDRAYRDIAVRCSEYMLTQQRADGAWDYPNPEWSGRVATAEGTWGSLGLLETYRHTGTAVFLAGAVRWHRFLIETIGFQRIDDELAINYFAHRSGGRVLNNSAFVLRFLAELAQVAREEAYLAPSAGLLKFLRSQQLASGEFPYYVEGVSRVRRVHFQCYQYNAFQCLDLIRYYELTREADALALIARVVRFLATGVASDGHARYACGSVYRATTYHAAAVGAALTAGARLGGASDLANRAYSYVLGLQRPDGSFPYSRRDYGVTERPAALPPVSGHDSAALAGRRENARTRPAGDSGDDTCPRRLIRCAWRSSHR